MKTLTTTRARLSKSGGLHLDADRGALGVDGQIRRWQDVDGSPTAPSSKTSPPPDGVPVPYERPTCTPLGNLAHMTARQVMMLAAGLLRGEDVVSNAVADELRVRALEDDGR